MRVLICPDKFAGTASAPAVAEAIAAGWADVRPGDGLIRRPLADGGPGFVEVLHVALGGILTEVPTTDPLGRPVTGGILRVGDTAYVECAQACGLHLLAGEERDPRVTTSFGLGTLILAAAGVSRIVVGLGGSATNDGGAGMLAALGVTPVDADGRPLAPGGAALTRCAGLAGGVDLAGVILVAATDVDNPLTGLYGASSVFGEQKGAGRADILLLDGALERFAAVLEKDLEGCPPGLAALPGAGAAGGLGAAILALGGRRESGIGLVNEALGLDAVLDEVDLVITGEGSFDSQSLAGKVISGVAGAAGERGVPVVVVAGRVAVGAREAAAAGIAATYSLTEHFGGVERAMAEPELGLRELGARIARQWAPRTT